MAAILQIWFVKWQSLLLKRLCELIFLLRYKQSASKQDRSYGIVDEYYKDYGNDGIDKGRCCTPFCKNFCHFLRLTENILLVEVTYNRIGNYIEAKTCNGGDQAPFENIFFVCTVINLFSKEDIIFGYCPIFSQWEPLQSDSF